MGDIFADELEGLDAEARQVVERIVAYLEKKYVSLPGRRSGARTASQVQPRRPARVPFPYLRSPHSHRHPRHLSRWQAHHVRHVAGRGATVEVVVLNARRPDQNVSFDKMQGKGFFTKKSNRPLDGDVDLAVQPQGPRRPAIRARGRRRAPRGPSKAWCWFAQAVDLSALSCNVAA